MRQIIAVLRLKYEAGLSHERIARACGLSKGVVGKYVSLARAQGVTWPLAEGVDEARLQARLFPAENPLRALPSPTTSSSIRNSRARASWNERAPLGNTVLPTADVLRHRPRALCSRMEMTRPLATITTIPTQVHAAGKSPKAKYPIAVATTISA